MTNKTEDIFQTIKSGVRKGLPKGWRGFVWLLKIILPISFATTLAIHFGVIQKLDFLLTPLMGWLSLPASAALVLIIGLFAGIYGAVAALSVMPLAIEHTILITVFILIAHNLIQESIVQGNSGINPFLAGFFRLFMALAVTFICAEIMGATPDMTGDGALGTMAVEPESFAGMIKLWVWGTFLLTLKMFFIIIPLMVALELAKLFNIISYTTKLITPFLSVMGLSRPTGMLWLTAAVFGLAYSSAAIVEETKANDFEKEALVGLHLSVGINHSMIEDPVLFLPLGVPMVWLWIPRIAAAMVATWLYRAFLSARRQYVKRTCHKKLCDN